MRKQYHFRPSENGFFAWDVDNLIALAAGLETVTLPISEISELDELWWFQEPSDVPTPRSILSHAIMINDVDLDRPILVDPKGRLMDGMHRVLKALSLDMTHVQAKVFTEMPEPDFENVLPSELSY